MVFTLLVMMTLFNEVNCRKLNGERNVFEGIMENRIFVNIVASTFVIQCLGTQFGGRWLKCYEGGLTLMQWLFCLLVGAGVLAWQQVINLAVHSVSGINETPGGSHQGGLLKFSSSFGSGHISLPKGATATASRTKSFKRAETAIVVGASTPVQIRAFRSKSGSAAV